VDGVQVHISDTTRVDITLHLGAVTENVEVTGAAALITPDTAVAGTVLTYKEYDNLPLATNSRLRIPTDFALLTPGVLGGQQRPGENHNATTSLSVDGSAVLQTDILVDGISAGQFQNFGSFTEMGVPVDAIGEFNIVKGAFSAEHGYVRTGLVSFSLKSGTNNWHGSLFEYFRNDSLNARAFFEGAKLPFHQNNFGGTITGPVRIPYLYNGKDRTFFMASSDNSFFRGASQIVVYTSPTAEFLRGDFSALRTNVGALRPIYDPATTVPDGRGGVTRQLFAGNVIPRSRVSPITGQVAAMYPLPNRPGTDANFVGRGSAADLNNYGFNMKIDHKLSDRHSLSGSHNYTFVPRDTYDNPYEGTVLLNGLVQDFSSKNARLAWDYIITPTIFNHWQFGYNRFLNPVRSYSYKFTPEVNWPERLGIKGVAGDGSMPVFQFSSDSYPQISSIRWDRNVEENILFRNTTSMLRGRHNWKFGFETRSQWFKTRRLQNQNGTLVFDFRETGLNANTSTGNSFASFLLGYVDRGNVSTPLNVASRRPYYAWFVQDDIKATSRLTLNLGLRYDLELPPYEAYDRASIFDRSTPNPVAGGRPGALIFAGQGPGRTGKRTFEDPYYRALAPRLGFAYQLTASTVLRGGYGISYSTHRVLNSYDGFATTANFISLDNGNTPAFRIEAGMPTEFPKPPFIDPAFGNNNNVTTTVRSEAARQPLTQIWRFDVQRELPTGVVAEVAYVGTRGTHLNAAGLRQFNQVDARYLSLGTLLNANITSAAAQQAGIVAPYPGFAGTVRQALRPYPQVLTIGSTEDKLGASIYHSLQVKVQKRFSSGLQYLVAYTNSKLLTDVQGGLEGIASSSIQDGGNRRAEWAVAPFDTPQNFWFSMIYELPFGPGKPLVNGGGLAGKLVEGWAISAVLNYQSGIPLRITRSNSLAIFNASQRPNRAPGTAARSPVTYSDFDPGKERIFNPAAFQSPAANAFGDAPPRLAEARNFGTRKEDLSARKNSRVNEKFLLEFNVQVFNLLNRPQWGVANDNHSSSDFGKAFKAGPGRFVQLGMKLHF